MIQPVGFLDLSDFTATFIRVYKAKMKEDGAHSGVQTIMLRGAEADAAVLKEWVSARKLLQRLKNEAAPFLNGRQGVLGKAFVTLLKPQAWTDWRQDDDPYTLAHIRTVTVMVPSPMLFFYSGGSAVNPPVGQVNIVGQQDLHSEANLGTNAVAWLTVDLKRPDED